MYFHLLSHQEQNIILFLVYTTTMVIRDIGQSSKAIPLDLWLNLNRLAKIINEYIVNERCTVMKLVVSK